jgi:hypothetical protein
LDWQPRHDEVVEQVEGQAVCDVTSLDREVRVIKVVGVIIV